jgi:Protein kinase domain
VLELLPYRLLRRPTLSDNGSIEEGMDASLEKDAEALVLTEDEQNVATAEEMDTKQELAVLGSSSKKAPPVVAGNRKMDAERTAAKSRPQSEYSTRSTVANWAIIVKQAKQLGRISDLQGLRELAEQVAFAKEKCPAVTTLSPASTSDAGPGPDGTFTVEQFNAKVAEAKNDYTIAYDITMYLFNVKDKLGELHTRLLMLSGRSQAEASCTGTASVSNFSDTEYNQDRHMIPAQLEFGGGEVQNKIELLAFGDRPIGKIDMLAEAHRSALQKFSKSFEWGLENARIFNDKPDKKIYKEALGKLFLGGNQLLIPGPMAAEVDYVQPYMHAVLQELASVVDSVNLPSNSPGKTLIQNNRPVPQTASRPKHVADMSIAANGRYMFFFRDDTVELPIEEKGGRKDTSPEQLLHECTDQILSALAKQVGISFNFAGWGIDGRATGVILTAAYVKIVQLELKHMGTLDAELVQLETNCLPLMSESSFKRWVGDQESTWKSFKTKLYGDEPSVCAGIPTGLIALWNLMTSSRNDLVGPSCPIAAKGLGGRLGFGAFATVHIATENPEHVIKVSRYGATATLLREASVLSELQEDGLNLGLSQLIARKKQAVTIGGINIELPALILAPRGISAEMRLAKCDENGVQEALLKIGEEIARALEFVHGRLYNHNDVSPKNIMHDGKKAFLIDFGLASSYHDKVKGFKGTPRYTHGAVFRKYPGIEWKPKPEYDMSSLAFSLAALSQPGKRHLWKSFQPFDISKQPHNVERKKDLLAWVQERSKVSWEHLENLGFEKSVWNPRCFDKV